MLRGAGKAAGEVFGALSGGRNLKQLARRGGLDDYRALFSGQSGRLARPIPQGTRRHLTSNEAINSADGFYSRMGATRTSTGKAGEAFGLGGVFGGIPRTAMNMQQGHGLRDAARLAHSGPGGGLDATAIAGSYLTASAGHRIATGGGLTRDRHGNPSLIGVPFV